MSMENNVILEEDTQNGRYLTFTLGAEVFGLEIRHVTSIIGIQPITPIPEAADYVRGLINLRGKVIPVIDVRLKFGKEPVEYNDRTCIIVLEIETLTMGLIVDQVSDVVTIGCDNIVDPPDRKTGAYNRYVKAVGLSGNSIRLLLDSSKLIEGDVLETIADNKQ